MSLGPAVRVDDLDTVSVAYVPFREVHEGFVRALLTACLEGMPALVFTSQIAIRLGQGQVIVSANEAECQVLDDRLTELKRRQSRAELGYLNEEDDKVSARFKVTFDEASEEIRLVERRLTELRSTSTENALVALAFEAEIDVLLAALRTVLEDAAKATRAQISAFHSVVPDLRIDPGPDGTWRATAIVRLPVSGGVADFGPIGWPVKVTALGVQVAHAARRPSSGVLPPESREELRDRLQEQGVAHEMARTLLNSPFRRELAQLVLHRENLAMLPEWLAPPWREPGLADHIARTYLDQTRAWAAMGRYLVRSAPRQALLSLLAANGGAMSMPELNRQSPRLHDFALNVDFNDRSVEVATRWPLPYALEGPRGHRTLVAHRCDCGQLATLVIRVPEIPSALLCRCGRPAMAEQYGLDTVRFPAEYQALVVPEIEWRAAVTSAPQIAPRTNIEVYGPRIAELLANGNVATTTQVMAHLGLSRGQTSGLLSRDPHFERAGRVGRADMSWRITQTPAAVD